MYSLLLFIQGGSVQNKRKKEYRRFKFRQQGEKATGTYVLKNRGFERRKIIASSSRSCKKSKRTVWKYMTGREITIITSERATRFVTSNWAWKEIILKTSDELCWLLYYGFVFLGQSKTFVVGTLNELIASHHRRGNPQRKFRVGINSMSQQNYNLTSTLLALASWVSTLITNKNRPIPLKKTQF